MKIQDHPMDRARQVIAPCDICPALNHLIETVLAAERRCVASGGRARSPVLKAELALRAAEHEGDAKRLQAALVLLRCTPHAGDTDASLSDPLWTMPPLSQPDDAALLRGCIAEEAQNVVRFERALRLRGLPRAVRETIDLCLQVPPSWQLAAPAGCGVGAPRTVSTT